MLPKGTSGDADRRLRQADRLSRVLRVLQLLQGRGRWNARSIADELEVSERTVYRDLTVLALAGVPWAYERDEGRYRLRPDYRFPALNLTDDELLGQATAARLAEAAGLDIGSGARPTAEKLAATSEQTGQILNEAQRLIEVLDLKLADQRPHRDVLHTVQWALLKRRLLSGLYQSPYEPKPVRLTLCPYRLCLVKACWYLIARPINRDQSVTLRTTRFKSLRMLDEPADVPQDFDLVGYFGNAWGVYRGDRPYDVKLRFDPVAAEVAAETTWHHTQRVRRHADGSATFSFRVDGLNEIVRWVLGWAGKVRVLEPAELRDRVVEQHRRAISMNGGIESDGRGAAPPPTAKTRREVIP